VIKSRQDKHWSEKYLKQKIQDLQIKPGNFGIPFLNNAPIKPPARIPMATDTI
jgi:hypothetical protein